MRRTAPRGVPFGLVMPGPVSEALAAATRRLEQRALAQDVVVQRDARGLVLPDLLPDRGIRLRRAASLPAMAACAEAAGVSADRVLAARRASELLLVVPWREPEASLPRLRETLGECLDAARRGLREVLASESPDASTASRRCARPIASARARSSSERCSIPPLAVHLYDDYVLHDLFDSAPAQGDRLIAHTLEPLLRLGEAGERLIETLDAYLRSGQNLKTAAAALAIHRNTLTYRLEQIRRETRFDLEDPDSAPADRGRAALPRAAAPASASAERRSRRRMSRRGAARAPRAAARPRRSTPRRRARAAP